MNLKQFKEKAFRERPELKEEYERFDIELEIGELFLKTKMLFGKFLESLKK
jgi:hypothetical protein